MSKSITRHVIDERRGRAVAYQGLLFVGGLVAEDRGADIEGQTRQVLDRLDGVLAAAGTDKSRVLSAQIWLKDIARDFAGMNKAWDAWTRPEIFPARATAQCEMGAPDILVEIVVTAALAETA